MRRALGLLALVALLAGCGTDLSDEAAEELGPHAAAVRAAAESGDHGSAVGELDALHDAVARHLAGGGLSAARAEEVTHAAEEVAALLAALEPSAGGQPAVPEPPPDPDPDPDDDTDDTDDTDDNDKDDDDKDEDEGDDESRGPDGQGPPGQRR